MDERNKRQVRRRLYSALENSDVSLVTQVGDLYFMCIITRCLCDCNINTLLAIFLIANILQRSMLKLT